MTTVVDASPVLVRLKGEAGAERLEQALLDDARCSTTDS